MSRTEALQYINAAHFFDHFFLLIFPTAALAIAPAWGMTYADVLLLGSPLYIMFAVGTPLAGWLGDRMNRMGLIALFFLGCGGASLFIAASSGTLALTIGLGILGLFAAIYHPVGLAHVTEIGLRTGRALAINGVFGNMGLAGAALITGLLAQSISWQAAFAIPGLLSILLGALILLRSRRTSHVAQGMTHANPNQSPPQDRTAQIRVFAIVCVSALLGGLIFNVITISLPKFFDERLIDASGDLAWIGASAGLVFAIAAFAQLPVGELLDRIGAKPVMLSLLGVQAFLLILLANATGWTALILTLALVTSIFAEIPVTSWLLGRYLAPGIRSRALSVEYTLSLGVGSVAVPLLALLHGQGIGFNMQFPGLAVGAFVIFIAALGLPNTTPRTTPQEAL